MKMVVAFRVSLSLSRTERKSYYRRIRSRSRSYFPACVFFFFGSSISRIFCTRRVRETVHTGAEIGRGLDNLSFTSTEKRFENELFYTRRRAVGYAPGHFSGTFRIRCIRYIFSVRRVQIRSYALPAETVRCISTNDYRYYKIGSHDAQIFGRLCAKLNVSKINLKCRKCPDISDAECTRSPRHRL